jgi:hypothetical protein
MCVELLLILLCMCVCRECRTWKGSGIRGYVDLNAQGKLKDGARDFPMIKAFFQQTEMTMVGLIPDGSKCGSDATTALCSYDDNTLLVYATTGASTIAFELPSVGVWEGMCYDPISGVFSSAVSVDSQWGRFGCPSGFPRANDDRIVLFRREE